MAKIIFEKEKCIGCGTCSVLCPKFWEMPGDGKSHLKDSIINPKTKNEELEIKRIECNQDAADGCPVQIIHITK
ncbi:MAG: ferredoxin [Candidatus Parcubacteria bacterium]|nr:ferredoxin [Candidatus Parcubacteria bacterium]